MTAVRESNREYVRTDVSCGHGRINGSIVTTRHTTKLNIKSIKLQTVPPLLCHCETFFFGGGEEITSLRYFLFFLIEGHEKRRLLFSYFCLFYFFGFDGDHV
jgi:hypothetical protein